MASLARLSLGPGGDTTGRSTAEGNAFQNPWIAATFSIPPRAICYGDVTIKELDRRHHGPHLKDDLITTIGQQGKLNLLATAMVQSDLLLTTAEQKQVFDNCHWAKNP